MADIGAERSVAVLRRAHIKLERGQFVRSKSRGAVSRDRWF
jgi:hypothetical protein